MFLSSSCSQSFFSEENPAVNALKSFHSKPLKPLWRIKFIKLFQIISFLLLSDIQAGCLGVQWSPVSLAAGSHGRCGSWGQCEGERKKHGRIPVAPESSKPQIPLPGSDTRWDDKFSEVESSEDTLNTLTDHLVDSQVGNEHLICLTIHTPITPNRHFTIVHALASK